MKAGHSHIGDIYKIDGAYYKAVDNNHHLVKIDPSDVDPNDIQNTPHGMNLNKFTVVPSAIVGSGGGNKTSNFVDLEGYLAYRQGSGKDGWYTKGDLQAISNGTFNGGAGISQNVRDEAKAALNDYDKLAGDDGLFGKQDLNSLRIEKRNATYPGKSDNTAPNDPAPAKPGNPDANGRGKLSQEQGKSLVDLMREAKVSGLTLEDLKDIANGNWHRYQGKSIPGAAVDAAKKLVENDSALARSIDQEGDKNGMLTAKELDPSGPDVNIPGLTPNTVAAPDVLRNFGSADGVINYIKKLANVTDKEWITEEDIATAANAETDGNRKAILQWLQSNFDDIDNFLRRTDPDTGRPIGTVQEVERATDRMIGGRDLATFLEQNM